MLICYKGFGNVSKWDKAYNPKCKNRSILVFKERNRNIFFLKFFNGTFYKKVFC